jgi:hypothetical protein
MKRFTNAIANSLKDQNWYAALTLALTLPDACGRMEDPGVGSEARYTAWWDKYMLHHYRHPVGPKRKLHTFLGGRDAYALRCAYLHEGSADIINQRARDALTNFHFVAPKQGLTVHRNQMNTTLRLQVDIFCREMIEAVEAWSKDVSANQDIQKRLDSLLVIHDISGGTVF